jgi:TRAP-type C4-dicarboxylate transport system permease small subunit
VDPSPATAPPAEGSLLAALGGWLFAHPLSTPQVLSTLGLGAVLLAILIRYVLERKTLGRALLIGFRRVEIGVLAVIVLGMMIFSAAQVLFRNLAGGGILWVDPLLRYATLWIGFLGAAVATREGRHIQMDVLGRLFPPRARRLAGAITQLAAAATCLILAESSYRHLAAEYANDSRELLQLPTWILLGVIPLSLALMTVRFTGLALFPPPPAAAEDVAPIHIPPPETSS